MSRFVAAFLGMEHGYNWNMLLMKHVVLLIKETFLCFNDNLKIVDFFLVWHSFQIHKSLLEPSTLVQNLPISSTSTILILQPYFKFWTHFQVASWESSRQLLRVLTFISTDSSCKGTLKPSCWCQSICVFLCGWYSITFIHLTLPSGPITDLCLNPKITNGNEFFPLVYIVTEWS